MSQFDCVRGLRQWCNCGHRLEKTRMEIVYSLLWRTEQFKVNFILVFPGYLCNNIEEAAGPRIYTWPSTNSDIAIRYAASKLHRLQPYIPEPNRTESSIPAVNSVRLVYYSNRTLSSASIETPIRFGSRSKIPSGEAIRLEIARYGSVRFENVRYGKPTLYGCAVHPFLQEGTDYRELETDTAES